MKPYPRFRQLKDSVYGSPQWGIQGPRHLMVPGSKISVYRSDGSQLSVTVGAIIQDLGDHLIAHIAKEEKG